MRFKPQLLVVLSVVISLAGLAVSGPVKAENYPVCNISSKLNVFLQNENGTGAAKLKVEVYEEDFENDYTKEKPMLGKKVLSGVTDSNGKWETTSFRPTINKRHIFKVYDKSQTNGAFYFFDQYTSCGGDFDFKKSIPKLTITLRDPNRNLIKNADVNLYAFHADVDGNPTTDPSYLISSSRTGSDGSLSYYVSGNVPQVPDNKGLYVLSVKYNSQTFIFSGIAANNGSDRNYEYVLSGLNLTIKNASGRALGNASVSIYNQNDGPSLGSKLSSVKTNTAGQVSFEFPSGIYALTVNDDFGQGNVFYNVAVGASGFTDKTITTNTTKIYLSSIAADPKGNTSRSLQLYSLTSGDGGVYYKNKSIGSLTVTSGSDKIVSLASGPYLLVYKLNNLEYGRAFMASNNEIRVGFSLSSGSVINSDNGVTLKDPESTVKPTTPTTTTVKPTKNVISKYRGYIVAVNTGGLWYIGNDSKRYRLDGSISTHETVLKLSAGISNSDLAKIPVGLNGMYGADSDKDGLSNALEIALGTNPNKADSDGDKYSDATEVKKGYNPVGRGMSKVNKTFANKQKGRFFIQIQGHGELWYISPRDGQRYFLFDGLNISAALNKIAIKITWPDIANLKQGN